MTLNQFIDTLGHPQPPAGTSPVLLALWHDANGNWEAAHDIAQRQEGLPDYDKLHAYLHRKEGDPFNAGYWYRRAKTTVFAGSLTDEWQTLVEQQLAEIK